MPATVLSIEERLARLEAIEAVTALKATYNRLADEKYTSAYERVDDVEWARVSAMQGACFIEDATWSAGPSFGGRLDGRASIIKQFERSPWRFAKHFYIAPEFLVAEPDFVDARWLLWQIAIPLKDQHPLLLTATTRETYRLTCHGWRMASIVFEELHTAELGAVPPTMRCLIPKAEPAA